MIADELRRQADTFVELQDLMPQIARAHSGNREAGAGRDEPARYAPRGSDQYDDDDEVI
jgi:hypothetical protein